MRELVHKLTQTSARADLAIARLGLGIVILPHGLQKLTGAFGGYGFQATVQTFNDKMGIPPLLAILAILAESFGALFLVLGLFGRLSALAIGFTMLVAALTVHAQNGFFMNWFGTQKGEGLEYFVLAIALAAAVVAGGSGAWSADQVIAEKTDPSK
ncbi:MAG: DoxX family protein [Armatimonadetes bacterium]|nr:DoxX family protein [Armatimonadota bacterium]MBX3108840.1 DoxX family protein [Fimbriimonadaceae bacterium]